jgi:hypothetical protein
MHGDMSSTSSAQADLWCREKYYQKRDANHHTNAAGSGPARIDRTSTDAAAIRGRAQMGIDANGGARSQGRTSGNAINGIALQNPNRETYMQAA